MAYNSTGNRFLKDSPVVMNLVIINVLVFLIQLLFDGKEGAVTGKLALWPVDSGEFKPYQLVCTHPV